MGARLSYLFAGPFCLEDYNSAAKESFFVGTLLWVQDWTLSVCVPWCGSHVVFHHFCDINEPSMWNVVEQRWCTAVNSVGLGLSRRHCYTKYSPYTFLMQSLRLRLWKKTFHQKKSQTQVKWKEFQCESQCFTQNELSTPWPNFYFQWLKWLTMSKCCLTFLCNWFNTSSNTSSKPFEVWTVSLRYIKPFS